MLPSRVKNSFIKLVYLLIDAFLIYVSIFLACIIRKHTLFFPINFTNLIVHPDNPYRLIFLFWVMTTVLCANANKLYQTRREVFEGFEVWLVIKCVIISSLSVIIAIYVLKVQGFPRSVWLIGGGFMMFFLSLWRVLKRLFVEYLVSRGYNNFNVLIVGAGRVGCALAEEISRRPGLGLRMKGFLDDFKPPGYEVGGSRVLGKMSDFVKVAQREFVSQIFITIHNDSKSFLDLLEKARQNGISVRVVPQGFDLISGELFRFNIGFIPILEYSNLIDQRKQLGKRLFDFVFGTAIFIFLLPLFLVIGLGIKLTSPGPVIYRSRRYSWKGKMFWMYKFRSMVRNADEVLARLKNQNEVDGPIFKIKNDPRVTPFGKFLRKYSLDELPQIINVIKGEMSLVGPRPLPIDQIEREDLRQYKRLEVRPGITGLWQIRGRSDLSFSRLLRWDLWYINKWSFWLDLYILLQTIPVVLKGKGAY